MEEIITWVLINDPVKKATPPLMMAHAMISLTACSATSFFFNIVCLPAAYGKVRPSHQIALCQGMIYDQKILGWGNEDKGKGGK